MVDASVTMAWCFADEASAGADTVLDRLETEEAVVPPVWPLEVANVLLVAERRGRLSEAQAARFVELLEQLPISVDDARTDVEAILGIGRRHQLSSYDASYLVLAARLGAPLATMDSRLGEAAERAGIRRLIA